jgi:acetyl-CoA C-acetyltransferase
MRKVAVLGIGQTSVGEHWERSLKDLASDASFSALADANRESVQSFFVGNMLSGMLSRQENIGALVADWMGLPTVEAIKIEAACGSGAAAFRSGLIAVASGEVDSALVVGIEKMTESLPVETTEALATASDADYEAAQGLSFVAINALVMQRYMHLYGWKHTDFGQFSINAHTNAVYNPYARLRDRITEDEYHHARMIAAPINLLDASPIGDGAAAVLLVAADSVRPDSRPVITIEGSASATDTIAIHSRKDPTWLSAAEISSKKAYQQAGLDPLDIDIFELHDAFSIMSALSLEACGFAEHGQAPRLALEGDILPSGSIPISTRGGLKARGHPVGATGIYQIVEVVQQLRGEAEATQVDHARVGMAQNIGGSGATVITHILQRNN